MSTESGPVGIRLLEKVARDASVLEQVHVARLREAWVPLQRHVCTPGAEGLQEALEAIHVASAAISVPSIAPPRKGFILFRKRREEEVLTAFAQSVSHSLIEAEQLLMTASAYLKEVAAQRAECGKLLVQLHVDALALRRQVQTRLGYLDRVDAECRERLSRAGAEVSRDALARLGDKSGQLRARLKLLDDLAEAALEGHAWGERVGHARSALAQTASTDLRHACEALLDHFSGLRVPLRTRPSPDHVQRACETLNELHVWLVQAMEQCVALHVQCEEAGRAFTRMFRMARGLGQVAAEPPAAPQH